MASGYRITSQAEDDERQPDGTYLPVMRVGYTTTSEPPVHGHVSVPAALASDPASYADAVRIAVGNRVAAHEAAAALGTS